MFWWLVASGQVKPTYNALLKLAVEYPGTLQRAVQAFGVVVLDEAHDLSDAGAI